MKKEWQVELKAEYARGSKTFKYKVVETESEALELAASFRRTALGKIGCPNRVIVAHVLKQPGQWDQTLQKTSWSLSLTRGWSIVEPA
jgi:hypothetical protein